MARSVIYTVTFDTNQGREITYELDIIAEVNDITIPGYTGTALPLVLDGQAPVTIEWTRRDDVYQPITGSTMAINLWVEQDGQYIDFNSAGERVFEVRLRRVAAQATELTPRILEDVWCGFIQPFDYAESVTTYPFQVRLEATDQLGLLDTQLYPVGATTPITTTDRIFLFDVVTDAITQTALNLDIYVDSGIRSFGGDALTSAQVTQYAFTDEDETDRTNLKDALTQILETFNCKVYQSNGRWYIINASTHGGQNDVGMFRRYSIDLTQENPSYTYIEDIVESLRYNIGNARDLYVIDQDFVFNPRLPQGSIQANVESLVPVNYVINGQFNDVTPVGWEATTGGDPLVFDDSVSLTGRSITSNRSTSGYGVNSRWFRNTNGIEVDYGYPLRLEFDQLWDRNNGSVAQLEQSAIVYVTLPSQVRGARLVGNSLGFLAPLFGQSPIEREEFMTNTLQWDVRNQQWNPVEALTFDESHRLINTSSQAGVWSNTSFDLAALEGRTCLLYTSPSPRDS